MTRMLALQMGEVARRRARALVVVLGGAVALSVGFAVPAAATTPDQSTTFKGDGTNAMLMSSQFLAQTFTPTQSGELTSVGLGMRKTGTVTNLTISITATIGGLPSGSALATTTLTGAALSVITTGPAIFDVTFSAPASVMAGAEYAITATTTDIRYVGSGGDYNWYMANAFTGGSNAYDVGSGWTALGSDFVFATYISPVRSGSGDLTAPPALLHQFGKPATATCDSSAPDTINGSDVPLGGWSESWAHWVHGGRGGAVCTRTLIYSPAQSRWIMA